MPKKGGFDIPSLKGKKGMPMKKMSMKPGKGIVVPSEMGTRGKPVHKTPKFRFDPRLD